MPRSSHTPPIDSRSLDIAKGVLVALRGCSPEQAFAELADVSQQNRLGTLTLARALVHLAHGSAQPASGPATDVALQTWGQLIVGARSAPSLT